MTNKTFRLVALLAIPALLTTGTTNGEAQTGRRPRVRPVIERASAEVPAVADSAPPRRIAVSSASSPTRAAVPAIRRTEKVREKAPAEPVVAPVPPVLAVPLIIPAVEILPLPMAAPEVRATIALPARAEVKPDSATPPTEATKQPAAITVGVGTVSFSGLIQAWYVGGDQNVTSTFRLRRAELKFVGNIVPSAKWTLMVDPAKSLAVGNTFAMVGETKVVTGGNVKPGSNLLQDAFITLGSGSLQLNAGQFKLPLGLEGGSQSNATLETVERGLFMARGGLGGNRDLGVMVTGPLSSDMAFKLGLFNGTGEGQNTVDTNDQKAAVGRVVLRTALPGLQLGASGAWSGIAAGDGPRNDRAGGDLLYVRGPLMLKSEVMNGWDGGVHGLGYYGHVGVKLTPTVEAIARLDAWNPNLSAETGSQTASERDYIAGINYFVVQPSVKLQANYLRKTFSAAVPSQHLLLLNLQTAW